MATAYVAHNTVLQNPSFKRPGKQQQDNFMCKGDKGVDDGKWKP